MMFNKLINIVLVIISFGIILSCNLNPSEETNEPFEVTFNDPNFEQLIRDSLKIDSGKITNEDLWSIITLDGSNMNISDITGIEYCSGLRKAFFYNNNISNINQLSNLVLLDYIDLQYNSVINLEPLVENTGIGVGDDIVQLYNNPLNDESIYNHIPQLQSRGVGVYSNAIPSSPGAITFPDANFEQVIRENLNIATNPILTSDLETLTNIFGRNRDINNIYGVKFCTNLDTLDLGGNNISDLIPIYYLWGITNLTLDNNNIEDITHLRYLTNLKSLNLNGNKVEDLTYIWELTELENLSIASNWISDISQISNLSNLNYISISDNPITSIRVLNDLDGLKTAELINLNQVNLNHIDSLDSLKTLYLSNSSIINFNSITHFPNLETLIMSNCSISEIDSLANLSYLRKLNVDGNGISDITALGFLYDITEFNLSDNAISDILPLLNNYGLGNGDYVLLYNNPLSDFSINTYIPILQSRGVNVFY